MGVADSGWGAEDGAAVGEAVPAMLLGGGGLDAEHTLLRCSAFEHLRTQFLLGAGLTGDLGHAAVEVLSGKRGREKEMWSWMMSSSGVQRSMHFLEQVMMERAVVLG